LGLPLVATVRAVTHHVGSHMEGSTETVSSGAPAASSGPSTFAEAFAADASSTSESSQQTTTPSAAEQPTAASESTPAGDDRSPFIPRARFDEVNTKLNELKSWREQHEWAGQVDRQQIAEAVRLAQRYTGDPIGFLQELAAEIQTHPEHGAKLRSFAAQQLAAARGQKQPDTGIDYNRIEIDLGNGQAVSLGDLKTQWMAEVEQKFQPVVSSVEQVNQERAALKAQHDAQQFAGSTVQEAAQWPGMDTAANRKAVAERIKGYGLTSDDPRDLQIALNRAWREVVLPTLSSKAQSQLLDTLQQKGAASTSVNPGSAAPSTPKTVTSFHQLGPEAWR
jgi:hypothetical protein